MEKTGHVAILMATCDGAAYLEEQLASIASQTHADWSLHVADDGSRDGTIPILERFAAAHPRQVFLSRGPGQGSAINFLTLLSHAPKGCVLAFADQDDVWMPDKLARSLAALDADGRGVFAGATIVADMSLDPIGYGSAPPPRGTGLGNALVQNVLAGNTIAIGAEAAVELSAMAEAAITSDVPYHDWWVYQAVTATGRPISYDHRPLLYYRQHGSNALGSRVRGKGALKRLRSMLDGTFTDWTARNLAALRPFSERFTPEARRILEAYEDFRRQPRMHAPSRIGLYRQSKAEDRILGALARLGRL